MAKISVSDNKKSRQSDKRTWEIIAKFSLTGLENLENIYYIEEYDNNIAVLLYVCFRRFK